MTIRNIRKNFLIAIVSSSLLAGAVIAIPFVANAQNGSSEKIISLDDPTNAIEEDVVMMEIILTLGTYI